MKYPIIIGLLAACALALLFSNCSKDSSIEDGISKVQSGVFDLREDEEIIHPFLTDYVLVTENVINGNEPICLPGFDLIDNANGARSSLQAIENDLPGYLSVMQFALGTPLWNAAFSAIVGDDGTGIITPIYNEETDTITALLFSSRDDALGWNHYIYRYNFLRDNLNNSEYSDIVLQSLVFWYGIYDEIHYRTFCESDSEEEFYVSSILNDGHVNLRYHYIPIAVDYGHYVLAFTHSGGMVKRFIQDSSRYIGTIVEPCLAQRGYIYIDYDISDLNGDGSGNGTSGSNGPGGGLNPLYGLLQGFFGDTCLEASIVDFYFNTVAEGGYSFEEYISNVYHPNPCECGSEFDVCASDALCSYALNNFAELYGYDTNELLGIDLSSCPCAYQTTYDQCLKDAVLADIAGRIAGPHFACLPDISMVTDLPLGYAQGFILDMIKESLPFFRSNGYDWFADMIDEMIDPNNGIIHTYGDLYDTYKLVREMYDRVVDQIYCQRDELVAEYMMAIVSPENVGIILSFVVISPNFSPAYRQRFITALTQRAMPLIDDLSRGFNTFSEFKAVYGPAGQNKHWHHIVEQHADNLTKFDPRKIHHPENLVKIDGGFSGSWHSRINSAYQTHGRYAEVTGPNQSLCSLP